MRYSCLAPLCTVFSLTPVAAQTAEQRQATVAYLRDCQQPDGGFVPAKTSGPQNGAARSSLRASTAGLRALKYFDAEPRDRTACAVHLGAVLTRPAAVSRTIPEEVSPMSYPPPWGSWPLWS